MLTSFRRVTILALQELVRNWWLSLATIIVIFLALTSVNVLFMVQAVTNHVLDAVEAKVDVSVAVTPETTLAEVDELRRYIIGFPDVASVVLVSRDDALARFRARHAGDPILLGALDAVGENPFGATLVIVAKEATAYGRILDRIASSPYQALILDQSFGDHRVMIERIELIANTAKRIMLAVSGSFILIAMLIIVNTIRMTIYTERDAIGIMKRVGATNQFARMPYVIMSAATGVLALALATGLFLGALEAGRPHLVQFLGESAFDLPQYVRTNAALLFGGELLGVLLLTVCASFVATRRYLRV